MSDPLVIRAADQSDLPAVLLLYAQPGYDDGEILSLDRALQIFERMNTYPFYRLYVAERDGSILGTYALLIMDNIGHLGTASAVVESVAVDPACQGSGIGRRMMAHALSEAAGRGCYKLTLSSNLKRKSAHAFYENLGFRQHGISFFVEMERLP
jgi:ribosomal protein S18 acetylase RimI-like enzyme